MTDETTTPESVDFGAGHEELRREFLMMLATEDNALSSLSESLGQDMVPIAIKAIAMELAKTSIELMEAKEEIADLKSAASFLGALVNGIMGLDTLVHPEDEDPELGKVRDIAQRTGAIIRESAGLEPLAAGALS
jgi:hypothetical protein